MNVEEIKSLTTKEKLRIMETIWEDMRERCDNATISEETLALLRQRQERVLQGESRLLDWDQVKFSIGRG